MDLDSPASWLSGMSIGLLGMCLLIFGRKQQRLSPVLAGIALSVLPMVVPSILLLWTLTAACLGGMYWVEKHS